MRAVVRRAALIAAPMLFTIVFASPTRAAAGEFGPLVLRDLDGQRTSLAALRGKVVVLNFWATWCQPCIQELPILADLSERYGDRGVAVVAASVDDVANRGEIAQVAARLPNTIQVWIGATLEDMERLELGMSVPVTVVLDRDGKVAERQRGSVTRGALDDTIEKLIGDAPKKRFDSVEAQDDGTKRSCELVGMCS